MNEKLTLIAAIVVEAFSKVETENIATATIRALMNNCEIIIKKDCVEFEAEDFGGDREIHVKMANHEDNIYIHTSIYSDCDDFMGDGSRTVVFAEAAHAIQFACSQIANYTLDPEFSIAPLLDSRVTKVNCDEDDEEDFDIAEDSEEEEKDFPAQFFVGYWYGTEPFTLLMAELEIQVASKEYALEALKEYESGDKFDEIVQMFEAYWEGDVSQFAWDTVYDLLGVIVQKMSEQLRDKSQRKTLLERISDWVKK